MYEYIKEDPRYADLAGKKRKIIFSWVQREFRNLLKAREAGVRVPTPLTFIDNVIVMEFIGDDAPAPRLKDVIPENPSEFFDDLIDNMRKLHKAGLVHADLSPFNILNYNEKPVFIDFSQSSPITVSRSVEFFDRDLHNVLVFFKKIGFEADRETVRRKILAK
jgi:RIO kinase 1